MASCHSPVHEPMDDKPSPFMSPKEETSSTTEHSTVVNGTNHPIPSGLCSSTAVSPPVEFPTPPKTESPTDVDLPSNFRETEEFNILQKFIEEQPTGAKVFGEQLIGDVYNYVLLPVQIECIYKQLCRRQGRKVSARKILQVISETTVARGFYRSACLSLFGCEELYESR